MRFSALGQDAQGNSRTGLTLAWLAGVTFGGLLGFLAASLSFFSAREPVLLAPYWFNRMTC